MPYDLKLAKRENAILKEKGLQCEERKMFGGVCFMVHGNMCCGVDKDRIMVRGGPKNYEKALKRRYAIPFDITKRPMKGFVIVESDGVRTKRAPISWIDFCLDFINTLPSK